MSENTDAAREYARRCRKGLPSDRFCDGHIGAVAVARGIDEMDWMLSWLVSRVEELEAEKTASGMDSMEAHADPMR